jgi:hypothetical protein
VPPSRLVKYVVKDYNSAVSSRHSFSVTYDTDLGRTAAIYDAINPPGYILVAKQSVVSALEVLNNFIGWSLVISEVVP